MNAINSKSQIGLAALAVLAVGALNADAVVEAVQIRLAPGGSAAVYAVPAGKVLIIEYVVFPNYWDIQGETKRIIIRHGGTSTSGSVWDTEVTYGNKFNSLLRPLKLPGGKAVAVPGVNGLFQCFIYGLLADATDLYAAIPSEFQGLGLASNGEGQLAGVLHTDSPRPKVVGLESANDAETWNPVVGASLSGTENRTDVRFELDATGEDVESYRALVHARTQELLPGLP